MFTLPKLPYDYSALEPYIDMETMKIHHTKHHQGYIDKLNSALDKYPDLQDKKIKDILFKIDSIPEDIKTAVRNFGGGHYNHTFFWQIMSPKKTEIPEAVLKLKDEFFEKSLSFFGSGWTWIVKENNNLKVINTANQDSVIRQGLEPLLAIDLWEHAYYLKYQNKRAEYIEAFWQVVNWKQVETNLQS